jgi:hypothetical protein
MMGSFNQMDRLMNQMMQPMIGFNPMMPHPNGNHRHHDPLAMNLFDGFGFGGGLMRTMNMASNDPNSMVFSQSTMISMNPDGTQRVISNSTRKAGDVKETRHSVQDGHGERVSVGHHIGDRSHFIEKKRDRDGRFRQNHSFVNMDQGEADNFNEEFKHRATRNMSGLFNGGQYVPDRRAIENGRSHRSNLRPSDSRQSGSAPVITVPDSDEDEDEEIQEIRPTNSRPSRHNPYLRTGASTSGPKIQEIDEETDAEHSKRRKGMFGKFFGPGDS